MSFQRPRIYRFYTHMKFANNAKTNHIMVYLLIWSAKDRWKYTKSFLKRMLEYVLKIQLLKEILEFQDWKRGHETYMKKNSSQKLNQLSNIYKMNFTNWKTNKQNAQNFVLPSDGSLRVKNALKLFSKYLNERICKIKQDLNLFDDNKSEHSSIPTDIFKSAKKFIWKILHQRGNFQNRHYWIS